MFEVAQTFMIQFIELMPSIIGLYVLFDFLGEFIPGNH